MANILKVKRSSVQGKIPLTTDLDLGELAVNTYDGKLFLKKNVGGTETIVDVTVGADAATILTLLKTVDGSGSGLDADLVEGMHAVSTNTVNSIVARDASGNFSAGTITAALSGNASTATKLATARTISITGDVTGSVSFDGSADASITATIAANSVALGTDTTGNYVADVTAGSYITKTGTAGEGWSPTIAVDATSANTASKVVARDASGNFSAGTITATLSGNASTASSAVELSTPDLRSTSLTPSYFGQGLNTAFMSNSTDGLADGGTYHGIVQFQQWTDASGGGSHQIGFTDNNNIWHRGSGGALTSWAAWAKLLDSSNYNSYAPTLTGTGASGTWGISITGNASTVTNGIYTTGSYTDPAWITSINYSKLTGTVPTWNQNTTGSAAKWTTARTLSFTGDATGSGSVDGSANVATALTLANSGVTAGTYTKITVDAKGRATSGTTLTASDIPSLDAAKITSGVLDPSRLPSYVDDVLEYTNLASFPTTGETGKIYVALDTNKTYRWSGSAYIYITSGAVDSVAGKTGVVTLTNADVGLGNVENKSSATIRSELTSTNVTTALGFTPYNSTNPNGYTTNTGTVTSVSGSGSVSGISLSGSVTTSGSLSLSGTLSASIDNITDEHRLFNNMGDNHGTRSSFDAQGAAATVNFGWRYVQGNTNAPNVGNTGNGQYYGLFVGLGNDYAYNTYGMQIAIPRASTTPYLSLRFQEGGAFGAWQKISAGYADSAGNADTLDGNHASAFYLASNPSGYTANTGTVTSIVAGTGLSGGTITTTGTIALANTAVTAGTYTNATVTVDAQGRITSASSGTGGGLTVTNDVATATSVYPAWTASTTGSISAISVSSTKLSMVPSTGTVTSAGNFVANSDERLKTNWRGVREGFVEHLAQLRSGVYDRVDCPMTQAGVSAQSLQDLLPEAVSANDHGILSVAYGNAALVSAVELAKEVVSLKAEVTELKNLVANLLNTSKEQ